MQQCKGLVLDQEGLEAAACSWSSLESKAAAVGVLQE
jgi:hypothetical protein